MANTTSSRKQIVTLVQLALFTAIIFVMAFTPLGYLRVATIDITFIMIPVIIGAIVIGPAAGAFLGGMFGITSFIQCFGISPFGMALFSINAVSTAVLCIIPRIAMGFLAGLIFRAVAKIDKTKLISFAVASLAGPLLNTTLFMTGLILMFGQTPFILDLQTALGTTSVFSFVIALVGFNGLLEAIVSFVVGTALAKVLVRFLPNDKKVESK
jgi:Predicted membrane protein